MVSCGKLINIMQSAEHRLRLVALRNHPSSIADTAARSEAKVCQARGGWRGGSRMGGGSGTGSRNGGSIGAGGVPGSGEPGTGVPGGSG
jgi:hypothetical protein